MKSAEEIAREIAIDLQKCGLDLCADPPCACVAHIAAALRAYGNERVEKAAKVADQEEEAWRSEAKASKYPDDSITCERYGYVSWGIARRIRAFIEKEPGA